MDKFIQGIVFLLLISILVSPYFCLWNLADLRCIKDIANAIRECTKELHTIAQELKYLRNKLNSGSDSYDRS